MNDADEIRKELGKWKKEDIINLYTKTYRRVAKEIKQELDEEILAGPGAKKTRSNWRFTCKKFIADLLAFKEGDPGYKDSLIQLCRLYDIMGRATSFFVSLEEYVREVAEEIFAPVKEKYESTWKDRFSLMVTEEEIICRDRYKSLLWFITAIWLEEGNPLGGWEYVKEINPNPHRPEITLYQILMYYANLKEDWIKIYDTAVSEGIEPRESLVEQRASI